MATPRNRKSVASATPNAEMMDTREVAAHLRLKTRRIYDLVRQRAIPHVRVTGKLLFPRGQIDEWLARNANSPAQGDTSVASARSAPPIIAGSHDPLLEWAVREARCGLAILACGSQGGIAQLARGEAVAAAAHWLDEASGEYNVPLVRAAMPGEDTVVIEWARRRQGLVVARGNPMRLQRLSDLVRRHACVVARQPEAGSDRLLRHLLHAARIDPGALRWSERMALAESDLAAVVASGEADAGLAIEAAAHAAGLAFIPLAEERIDLVARRRDVFEPALQALLAFARTPAFAAHAAQLRGYDVSTSGRVVFNA